MRRRTFFGGGGGGLPGTAVFVKGEGETDPGNFGSKAILDTVQEDYTNLGEDFTLHLESNAIYSETTGLYLVSWWMRIGGTSAASGNWDVFSITMPDGDESDDNQPTWNGPVYANPAMIVGRTYSVEFRFPQHVLELKITGDSPGVTLGDIETGLYIVKLGDL
jgi:hypothetical protein